MRKSTITIPVDPQTAQAYDAAPPEDKRKIQVLRTLWLRDEPKPLPQILDEVGRKAQDRALTQELLDSLLKGA